MNEFLQLLSPEGAESLFGPLDILVVLAMVGVCMTIVSKVYQATHRGTSYAQSYIHSLFLMGLCTGIVMMIIGSNIARAFSLVGALSIIRFRTAVKDVRDTAYLFFAVVIGMGAGTGFYLHTVVFTLSTAAFMWLLYRFDFAARHRTEEVLKVTVARGRGTEAAVGAYLEENFEHHRLINTVRDYDGDEDTLVYVVTSGSGDAVESASRGLSSIDGVASTAVYLNDQQVVL